MRKTIHKTTISDRKDYLLDKQIELLDRLKSVCEQIKDGLAESYACHTANVDVPMFRKYLFNNKLGYDSDVPPLKVQDYIKDSNDYTNIYSSVGQMLKEKKRKELMAEYECYLWQEKIWCNVFKDYEYEKIPIHVKESVEYVLDTINPRLKDFLLYRFRNMMTYKEIGDQEDISLSRARELTEKALRAMRLNGNGMILRYGVEYKNEMINKKKQHYEENFKYLSDNCSAADATESQINEVVKLRNEINTWLGPYSDMTVDYNGVRFDPNIAISDITFSDKPTMQTRIQRALYRNNVSTLLDLFTISEYTLSNMKNLGEESIQCVANYLKTYHNYELPER